MGKHGWAGGHSGPSIRAMLSPRPDAAAPASLAQTHAGSFHSGSSAWIEPRFSPVKVAAVVQVLDELGVPSSLLLEGTGIAAHSLRDPDALTSTAQLYEVLRRAVALCPSPEIGVRAGQLLRITGYGMYGYALLCSPTLRDGMEMALRYHALANPLVPIRVLESGDTLMWVFPSLDDMDLPGLTPALYRVLIEMQMAIHVTLARDAMGAWCIPASAHFAWARPPHEALLGEALECPVHFGRPRCELHYPRAWLNRSPQWANAITAEHASRACAKLMESLEGSTTLSRRVYRELMRTPGRFPSIEAIAATLCMTGRTLRRRLQVEGTSYAELLGSVRRALAEDYLCATRMSIEDIASALAFSDARSFRHAFVRWTGRAPTDYRRGAAARAPVPQLVGAAANR